MNKVDATVWKNKVVFEGTSGKVKERLKADPELAARSQKMGNKDDDYLLEIVDAFAAKTIGTVLLETGKGSFDISSAFSEKNWLVLHDSTNRILAYSIDDGVLQQRFFGSTAAISPINNKIAVENYAGEVTIYNISTGDKEGRLILNSDVAFLRFSLDGKRLFVLTDQQVAYSFDVNKVVKEEPTARLGF
jgi:hypothetical protein